MIEAVGQSHNRVANEFSVTGLARVLGEGKVDGVAYDTASVARLAVADTALGLGLNRTLIGCVW